VVSQSALEVTTERGEYDLAVVDLSLPHGAEAVTALAERLGTRVTLPPCTSRAFACMVTPGYGLSRRGSIRGRGTRVRE